MWESGRGREGQGTPFASKTIIIVSVSMWGNIPLSEATASEPDMVSRGLSLATGVKLHKNKGKVRHPPLRPLKTCCAQVNKVSNSDNIPRALGGKFLAIKINRAFLAAKPQSTALLVRML